MGGRRVVVVRLRDRAGRDGGSARPVQPCAPRRVDGDRLPLLPYVGGGVIFREHSAHQDVHELPFADLDERADPRAYSRELPREPAAAVDARPRFARFRVLQPQQSRRQRSGVCDVPWSRGPDAAHLSAELAADEVVSGLVVRRDIYGTTVEGPIIMYHMSDWTDKQTLVTVLIEVSQEVSINHTTLWQIQQGEKK